MTDDDVENCQPTIVSSTGISSGVPQNLSTPVCEIYSPGKKTPSVKIYHDGEVWIDPDCNLTHASASFWQALGIPLSNEKLVVENAQLRRYIQVLKNALEGKWNKTQE